MKKILLVVSIACATMVANAANIAWVIPAGGTLPNLNPTDFMGADGATIYLFAGEFVEEGVYSNADAIAALEDGTFHLSYLSSNVDTAGPSFWGGMQNNGVYVSDSLTDGTSYSFFVVAFNTKTATGEQYYMISGVKSGNAYTPPASADLIQFNNFTTVGWNLYTPVPEPAMMAFIGLGAALVGLRRRRK